MPQYNYLKSFHVPRMYTIRHLIRDLSFGGRNSKKQVRLLISFAIKAFSYFEIELIAEESLGRLNSKATELKTLKRLALILNTKPLNLVKFRTCLHELRPEIRQILSSSIRVALDTEVDEDFEYYIELRPDLAIATLERTRALLREPTGRRHSTAKLNLVRSLVQIYETASGDNFAISSSSSQGDSRSMTAKERLLYDALKLVDRRMTADGMRELYRAARHSGLSTFRKTTSSKA